MDKSPDERLADALGEFLVALAGDDRAVITPAAQNVQWIESIAASERRERPGLFSALYAAEMIWFGRAARRDAGLDDSAHSAALVAIETILENELAALHRVGDLAEGVAAALAADDGKAVA